MNWADFHFLRPLLLAGLVPAAALIWLLVRQRPSAAWQRYFTPQQLQALTLGRHQVQRHLLIAVAAAWALACIGLAGPTWEQRPLPAGTNQQPLVIMLDLSPSMLVEDVIPNRLTRARLKLIDLLRSRQDGETALIAYGGSAHLVAPLTPDANTIEALLPALSPAIMPVSGSDTEAAFVMATELLANAGYGSGDILLITDGVEPAAQRTLQRLNPGNIRLSILGIGTEEGAPIPARGGFLRDARDQIVVAQLNRSELQSLAQSLGGRYADLDPGERDIDSLLAGFARPILAQQELQETRYDQWYDMGYWFCLALLPFALLAWRRGLVFGFALVLLPNLYAPRSEALDWDSLWLRTDQQAARALAEQDYAGAAELFQRPDWRAYAQFRDGNYDGAAESLSHATSAEEFYNLGNALVGQGDLESAITAYDIALGLDPDHADARFNKALLDAYMEQQQERGEGAEGEESENEDGGNPQQDEGEGSEVPEQSGDSQGDSEEQSENGEPQDGSQDEYANPAQTQSGEPESDQGESEENEGEDSQQQQNGDGQANQPAGSRQVETPTPLENGELSPSSEQWLRTIPDDPSGLLRRKFQYQSEQYRRDQRLAPSNPNDQMRY